MAKNFESFRVEENDDGTFSIDLQEVRKKNDNDDDSPMSFHESIRMTASSKKDLMEKIESFFEGKNAVKEFLTS